MAGEIVSRNQCLKILNKYIKEIKQSGKQDEIKELDKQKEIKEFDNQEENKKEKEAQEPVLTSFSTCPTSNQLDGLIGEQFFLTLNYKLGKKEKKAKFFVKIISKGNPIMYKIAKEIEAFEKESFFYDKLVPYLREEGFECDYVANSYLCDADTIVLEDLGLKSYKGSGKNLPLDLNHCKMCLKTLAKFHSDTILFELKKSKDLAWEYKISEAFPEIFENNVFGNEASMVVKYYKYSVSGLHKLTPLIPEGTVKAEEFTKAFVKTLEQIPSISDEMAKKFRVTLCHNDLWCNNILYKYNDQNEILSCKIIDFQTLSPKPPICDVLSFLYTNTRKDFRDEHFNNLLSYYYECFSELIELAGYNCTKILSEEEFWASYDFAKLTSKVHAIIDRSLTLIPDKVYTHYSSSEEIFSNFVFEGRGSIMMGLFQTVDNYREIITEELCELRSMLFGGD